MFIASKSSQRHLCESLGRINKQNKSEMKKINLIIIIVLGILFQSKAQFMEPNFINNDTDIYSASFIAEWGGDTAKY